MVWEIIADSRSATPTPTPLKDVVEFARSEKTGAFQRNVITWRCAFIHGRNATLSRHMSVFCPLVEKDSSAGFGSTPSTFFFLLTCGFAGPWRQRWARGGMWGGTPRTHFLFSNVRTFWDPFVHLNPSSCMLGAYFLDLKVLKYLDFFGNKNCLSTTVQRNLLYCIRLKKNYFRALHRSNPDFWTAPRSCFPKQTLRRRTLQTHLSRSAIAPPPPKKGEMEAKKRVGEQELPLCRKRSRSRCLLRVFFWGGEDSKVKSYIFAKAIEVRPYVLALLHPKCEIRTFWAVPTHVLLWNIPLPNFLSPFLAGIIMHEM